MEYPEAHTLSFNRWAESNNIVVLWPHMGAHGNTSQGRKGCWDGYGSSGLTYDTKSGAQMDAVRKMIERVSGARM